MPVPREWRRVSYRRRQIVKRLFIELKKARESRIMSSKKKTFESPEIIDQKLSSARGFQEKEQIYRTIWENSVVGLYIVQDGEFRSLNGNATACTGYKIEELIGEKSDSIVHPADRMQVKRYAREMLRGERTSPHLFRIIDKQGDIRWVMETVTTISYEGRPAILGNSMDITERVLAEESLRESERRLADIIDFLPDPTYAIDLDGKLIAWNRAMEEMTGVKAKDILGKGNYEHALHFYGDRRPMLLDLVLDPGSIKEEDYSLFKRQGELLIAERYIPHIKSFLWGKASPLYDRNNKVVGAIQSLRDITEQKRAEEALRESERRLADIIDFLPDPTYAIDLEGRIIAWNRAMEEMTGVKAKDILGKGNYEHALHFYGERRPMLVDLVLDPGSIKEEDYSLFEKQGELLIAERYIPHIKSFLWGKASPLYDRNNKVVGAIQSIRDITERKRAEDILRESENRYRTIFENTGSAMLIVEEDTTITLANTEFENIYGYSKEEIENKVGWTKFIVKEDLKRLRKYHYSRRIDPTAAPRQYESRIINKNKEVKDVWINTALIPGTSNSIVSLFDITNRKKAEQAVLKREQELKAKASELEELNAALRVLLKCREEDKTELEEKVLSNIKQLVLPYLDKLKKAVSDYKDITNLNIIESNLKGIISPFAQKLSSKHVNLTPKEIQVANLIKEGKTTKEIADYMDISKSAIDTHRYHIRQKLGLLNEKANLQSYLSSIFLY
jgi:PAS domain S-box-containing protein